MHYETPEAAFQLIRRAPSTGTKIYLLNVKTSESYAKICHLYDETETLRLSNYAESDNIANRFNLFEDIKSRNKDTLVLGLSPELLILPLNNQKDRISELFQLPTNSSNLPHTVVFLFYQNEYLLNESIKQDYRLTDTIILIDEEKSQSDLLQHLYFITPKLKLKLDETVIQGFKKYLTEMEISPNSSLVVQTRFSNESVPNIPQNITCISSSYTYLRELKALATAIPEDAGTNGYWDDLLQHLSTADVASYLSIRFQNKTLNVLFTEFAESKDETDRWYLWLQMKYLLLKKCRNSEKNTYLYHVISKSINSKSIIEDYVKSIADIPIDNKKFEAWYDERKKGLRLINGNNKNRLSSYIYSLLAQNMESNIYYFTDTTEVEKYKIIDWICNHGVLDDAARKIISRSYPDLEKYLRNYCLPTAKTTSGISVDLTNYFDEYKHQKITNTLSHQFLEYVNQISTIENHISYSFPLREDLLQKKNINMADSYCCFIDCLGVEYLSLIDAICKEYALTLDVAIATANIPTKTSFNKEFISAYPKIVQYHKIDEIKHKGAKEIIYDVETGIPHYIVDELTEVRNIFEDLISKIDQYQRLIVITDHGSSRLCTLKQKQGLGHSVKIQAEEVSERYCLNPAEKIESDNILRSTNGEYYVWTNYNRFSTLGKPPSWETHGGASIEEIIIPVIEISRNNKSFTVTCLSPDIKVQPGKVPDVTISVIPKCSKITIEIDAINYPCNFDVSEDRWHCPLPPTLKSGEYTARILSNSQIIGEIKFSISIGMKKNLNLLNGLR